MLNQKKLPVDIVLAPCWWNKNAGITFDEDFFYDPIKRVESERKMEQVLYGRWGEFGLGENHDKNIPHIGAVHLAAGFMIQEMLGCEVSYRPDDAPQVNVKDIDDLTIDVDGAFESKSFQRLQNLIDSLKKQYGYLAGDVNWGGILNIALDLRGQSIFIDMFEKAEEVKSFFKQIAQVIEKFISIVQQETGSSSISVNRLVKHFHQPVLLHSECSHTMISTDDYEKFLLPFDIEWSKKHRPFGIHFCGSDPHRFVESFAKIPELAFLDVGWGGDIELLRKYLPNTFLNLRLSPVELINQTPDEIKRTIKKLVSHSGDINLTGICCINIDSQVSDDQINAIFEAVCEIKQECQ